MKLSEGVEAAVHSVAVLAQLENGRTLPASALAELYGLSQSYLLKHLQALAAARVLVSVPGPHGGYRLAKPPKQISLLDIVLAVEGSQPAFRCTEIRQRGPGSLEPAAYVKPCGIKVAMLKAETAWRAVLAQTKLSDILAGYMADADPRSISFTCAFVARHQRPQGDTVFRDLKQKGKRA